MNYDLAVIGAGPAGIACAYEAQKKGLKAILFEKANESCQTFRIYYKDGKRVDKVYNKIDVPNEGNIPFEDGTKESTLELFDGLLSSGFEYKSGAEVDKVTRTQDGFIVRSSAGEINAKNVVIAIGRMGKPNKPSYKLPSSLKKVINFNANDAVSGEKILVVGGGNSAAEYAVDLSANSEVTLCYRKDKFTRLNETNLENVNKAKMTLKMGTDITEISDEDGKCKVFFTDNSSEIYDRVIYGIGGSTPVDFLRSCNVEMDEKGVPSFDEFMQTNESKIFVAGDIASRNGQSIIMALNNAKKIVDFIA